MADEMFFSFLVAAKKISFLCSNQREGSACMKKIQSKKPVTLGPPLCCKLSMFGRECLPLLAHT